MKYIYPSLLAITLGVNACKPIGPDYSQPETIVPDQWNASIGAELKRGTPNIENWWQKFNDPTLNKIIAIAEKENKDLKIAAERIEQARAQRGIARGGLQPFVGAGGGVAKNRSSESLPFANPNPFNYYEIGTSAGWELDFIGGIRRSIEAASASYQATQEVYHDTMVIVYAEVASSYIEYRTLERRIKLAQTNISNQQQSVDVTRERKKAGLAPQIDVSQAETNLSTSSALIPQLQTQLASTRSKLAVLLGKYPSDMNKILGSSSKIPKPSGSIAVGIPADLIRSRPDIRFAERQLAAQTAVVGVSMAELYPKFSLLGTFALQSGTSDDFFDTTARAYTFGPSFSWRIFEGGRIRESIKVEESLTRQALTSYEKTVLQAVAEVETSMASIRYEGSRKKLLDSSVTSARETVSLIKENYTQGLVDFQNVLDAERTIFANEDNAASSAGRYALNYVALYRALGGGSKIHSLPISEDK